MKSPRKAVSVISLSLVMMFGYSLPIATVSNADSFRTSRISGRDRIETSLKIADKFIKADNVVIAGSQVYADALVASPLANKLKAPIILNGKSKLDERVLREIKKLGAKNVIIAGGTGSISEEVEKNLKENGLTVRRIAGRSRYDTSAKIAEAFAENTKPEKVIITSGENFPDALVAGPFASRMNAPILLSTKTKLMDSVKSQVDSISPKEVIAIGGENSLSPDNVKLSKRISGNNRYDTALYVAQSFDSDTAYIASGEGFADSLVAAPLAAKTDSPILLREKGRVQKNVKEFLESRIKNLITVGGVSTVMEGTSIENTQTAENTEPKPSTKDIGKIVVPSPIRNRNTAPVSQNTQVTPTPSTGNTAPAADNSTPESTKISEIQREFDVIINNYRAAHSLGKLQWYNEAKDGANIRTKEIISEFSHVRPNGEKYKTVYGSNVSASSFGENIGMTEKISFTESSPKELAQYMFQKWKESPTHDANMLKDRFNRHYMSVYHENGAIYFVDEYFGSVK